MPFFDVLEPFHSLAQRYLDEARICEVIFSGPTYQIGIRDRATEEFAWVFIQFSKKADKLQIKDFFCSCQQSSEAGACEHMAAAFSYLVHKGCRPPHLLFPESIYKILFFELFARCSARDPVISKRGKIRKIYTHDRKLLGTVYSQDEAQVSQLMMVNREETEENSIKFSTLTEEELDRWRQRQASLDFCFELSFMSDIAKYLFLHGSHTHLYFQDDKDGLPCKLHIEAPIMSIDVPLNRELLEELLQARFFGHTNRVKQEFPYNEIAVMRYDEMKRCLNISFREYSLSAGTSIGEYIYVPGKAFIKNCVLRSLAIEDGDICDFLDLHAASLQKAGVKHVDLFVHRLQYHVSFTETDCPSLRIEAYIRKCGDLEDARIFSGSRWGHEKKRGFFRIDGVIFDQTVLEISLADVSDFIQKHRFWLDQFPGFHVHSSLQEEHVRYEIDGDENLLFYRETHCEEMNAPDYEFGSWVYYRGKGFYPKQENLDSSVLLPYDLPIPRARVSNFILRHIDIVSRIPNFFTHVNPIAKMGICVRLKTDSTVEILPVYEWRDLAAGKRAVLYDEFVYTPKVGFYQLPISFRPLHYIREITRKDKERWEAFFLEELPKLQAEFDCTIDPRLRQVDTSSLVVDQIDVSQDHLWKLRVHVRVGEKLLALTPLLRAKKRGDRFVPTEIGLVDLTHEQFQFLPQLQRKKVDKENVYTLSSMEVLKLQSYMPLAVTEKSVFAASKQKEIFSQLLEGTLCKEPSYPILQANLRSYQQAGVSWLWYLYQNGLSGLLCDDMGVGKTHQAMALMAAVYELYRSTTKVSKTRSRPLFLIICPTSLVFHWEEKIHRFLPGFRVQLYVASTQGVRSLDNIEDVDVIITTYHIFRSDVSKFSGISFEVAIFDELQIAKNHVSQIHAALLKIKAKMRLGLTGTPIENQLRELKSVCDLVLPGYMPEPSEFREFFVRPIEREMNEARKLLLSRLVKPFVLRRKKEDVLSDLPEKIEEICLAELVGEQKVLYKHVSTMQATTLLNQLQDLSAPIPYMHIFSMLTALKQICNHPATYMRDVQHYTRYESGKWDLFTELLEEAIGSGQKVVVFSQYLSMLDIMKLYLQKIRVGYAEIRGGTKRRGEEIEKFHKDPNCLIFLGSLHAAGLGIDLTPAEVVIHYDRWWNAAREDQATDRVHRLGQKKCVEVCKLKTKYTIEVQIDEMISRKKNLLEDVVTVDDHNVVKKIFTRDEIIQLLEDLRK